MIFDQFRKAVQAARNARPELFDPESDRPASAGQIACAEMHLGVILPDAYKDFLTSFGGGFFGFTIVYSLDETSDFYLLRHNTPQSVALCGYIAVIDYETGDTAGFRVHNGVCGKEVYIFDHENRCINYTPAADDLLEFLLLNGLGIKNR